MKSQINLRASTLTTNQLAELTDKLGTSITETISLAIDRMYQQEIKTMTNHGETTYYIDEQMLGDEANEQDARLMVKLLREHGHDVEYGEPVRRNPEPPFNDAEWQKCLSIISRM